MIPRDLNLHSRGQVPNADPGLALENRGLHGFVNVADFSVATDCLGPGRRAVVWVQGCPRRCDSCINPDMLQFGVDREWISCEELTDRILREMPLEGVTFVGGEPFSHAAALANVAGAVRRSAGISTMTFTGYTLEQLRAGSPSTTGWERLLTATDLLVDGEYVASLECDLLWRGSSNQRLHFLTDRYASMADILQRARGRLLEISVRQSGQLRIVGIPDGSFVAGLFESLESRGVRVREPADPSSDRGAFK